MDANTPETQAMPSGNPNEGNPNEGNPNEGNPNEGNPNEGKSVHGEHGKPIQDAVNAPAPPPPPPAPTPTPPPSPAAAQATAQARPKGLNPGAIVLGLVALVLAALIIASETMDLRIDWSALGPGAIVGIGVLLVVLGAVGLVRRHDDR